MFFVNDGKGIIIHYVNAPPEVRRTDTGAVIATLPGELSIEKFSPQETVFVANRTDAPAELRRTSDGVLLSQLGQVEGSDGVAFSPDGSAFVVDYAAPRSADLPTELRRTDLPTELRRTDLPTELRRTADGTVITELRGIQKNNITFSPDGTMFVLRYSAGFFGANARPEFELRHTRDGGCCPPWEVMSPAIS